ncbi:MAG: hypothetical protein ACR2L2_18900 [Acidobacteriota bacterium]
MVVAVDVLVHVHVTVVVAVVEKLTGWKLVPIVPKTQLKADSLRK